MYRSGHKWKNYYLLFVLVLIFCLSIGYAVINRTLNITGNSEVFKNTWSIYFDNVKIVNGSVTASKEPTIDNDKLNVDFSFNLELPGDFYAFTVDVKNSGSIDAMIESISKTPELTTAQAKYLNYSITYINGEEISSKQTIEKNSFVRLLVKVEYRDDITSDDLPITYETLNLGFTVNYIQADSTGVVVEKNGIISIDGDINEIGTIVTIGTEKFYIIGTDGNNVKLLSMYNLHVGSEGLGIKSDNYEIIKYEIENPTGMQSNKAKGALIDDDEYIFPWTGITAFASEEQHGTNYTDYEGSIVEGYVNNYKNLLESKFDVIVNEARLITKEELINESTFACNEDEFSCLNSTYPWIYSTTYWTSSVCESPYLWFIASNGWFAQNVFFYDGEIGVRPVIVVSMNELLNLISFTIEDVTYYAEEGMTWAEWEDSYYNTKNISIDRICGDYEGNNGEIYLDDVIESNDVIVFISDDVCSGGDNN